MSTLCGQQWDAEVVLVPYCIEELLFWRSNLASLKARDCFIDSKPSCFAYSDASDTGCGSVITSNQEYVCHKLWDPSECSKSSTWRELAPLNLSAQFWKDWS